MVRTAAGARAGARNSFLEPLELLKGEGDVPVPSCVTTPGTLGYRAPELATGGRATKASDLYSLGVILEE